jgi:beta-N-acetylhexosaminidase
MADDGVTLVRLNWAMLPLKKSGTAAASLPYQGMAEVRNHLTLVVFTDDVRLDSGRGLERQIRTRVPDVNVIYVDPRLAKAMAPAVVDTVSAADQVLVAVYSSPTAGKMVKANGGVQNSVSMVEESADLFRGMLSAAAAKTVVVAFGNPYLAKDFPEVQNYLCTFSAAAVSEVSAVKALFGEIEIHGHLPVTIPGIAARGDGIMRPATK